MATARRESWGALEPIALKEYLRLKKWAKYYDRRSAGALVTIARLLAGKVVDPRTPIHWALGDLEFQDYGLETIREKSRDTDGRWNSERFAREGMHSVSPLTQFKVLYNMPLCLAAMELDLVGENSVTHGLDEGMLVSAAASRWEGDMILGALRCLPDGGIECVAALARPDEIPLGRRGDILEILGEWIG
ncbi:MAG: hypothetical protein IPK50_10070 [Fibrobacterota bacterium]|nr:hypothetical protein [Fibrobacterota bacterium]QQS07224.1 MAG: hypothetical protein IPK50_10070 [Fibrobacterota bacterium]